MLPAPHYWNYYSIHFMRSRDGGANWERLDGDPIALPVIADEYGPTHEVNPPVDRNASPWLWSMIVKQGKAHFWFRVGGHLSLPMRYVTFDTVSGDREQNAGTTWGGANYLLSALQGDCSTRRERLDGTIYCISTSPEADDNNPNTPRNDRLAVVYTTDNGETWQDYALTVPYASCTACYYGINTARQLAEGSRLIGSFTQEPRDPVTGVTPMRFFSVPVLPPPNLLRVPATVTTSVSVADPTYSADKAGDGNASTQWVASFNPSTVVANNNAWIQLDFGAVTEVDRLSWIGAQFTPYPAHSPSHYTVTASNDGVNWTTVASRTHASAVVIGVEPIYLNTRYLRLTTTKVNDGSGWSLSFFEFWAEGPARSRLPTTAANASAWEPSYPPAAATDGALNTLFVASTTPHVSNNNAWFYIDLGSPQPIARLKWRGGVGGPYPAHLPADYSIQVSNDLGTWLTLKSRTNPVGVLNGDELIAATARYVRVLTTKINDGTGWSLGFGEFWVEH
jgi:hypothetical protein